MPSVILENLEVAVSIFPSSKNEKEKEKLDAAGLNKKKIK